MGILFFGTPCITTTIVELAAKTPATHNNTP